ncbi:Amino-acid carrier protein AlsT [Roseovarius albus]|uniref:Amino-acid carrier protein AlsT n=1 Tax=Roseovarius albus TaxID=1247867 RepID=A0A1X6Z5H6_9RHOB|nr:hypothetical protein [Roseovarius albus]SLN40901.1 Amino-acid carrier protein AlsT [Roseovarius albus]
MTSLIDGLNGILWNYVLIYGLLGAGAFFTLRLGAIQFLHIGEMIRVITSGRTTVERGISPFRALTVSHASRVGTLIAVLLLSKTVIKLTKDYFDQRRAGQKPKFAAKDFPEFGDGIDHSVWK